MTAELQDFRADLARFPGLFAQVMRNVDGLNELDEYEYLRRGWVGIQAKLPQKVLPVVGRILMGAMLSSSIEEVNFSHLANLLSDRRSSMSASTVYAVMSVKLNASLLPEDDKKLYQMAKDLKDKVEDDEDRAQDTFDWVR